MIKLIIFDLCGVIFHCEEPPFFRFFAKKYDLPIGEVEKVYLETMKKAEEGKIKVQEALSEFINHFNANEDPDKLLKVIISFKKLNNEMLLLVKKLKERYKLAYLTNSSIELMRLSEEKFPINQYFDFGLISEEVKVRKPDPKGFEIILSNLNIKPKETIFIDDSAKNMINAETMGINTIKFNDFNELAHRLKGFEVTLS